MNINYLHKIAAGLALTVVFTSCMKDENSFGYEYMPDMYRSPAQEVYVDYGEVRTWKSNDSIKNTQSAKLPPMGTIPFQGSDADPVYSMPYNRLPSEAMIASHSANSLEYSDLDYEASANDVNPMKMYESNVKEGKRLYETFCDHCHGEKGAGDGAISRNGYIIPPANAFTKAEGQMFYSITYGKGSMGSHASQLNKKERWQVISYIKSMAGAASIPDPEEMSADMDSEETTAVDFESANSVASSETEEGSAMNRRTEVKIK
ncbi:MAG: c-type cytochrome [Flavobacteriales bacterium]